MRPLEKILYSLAIIFPLFAWIILSLSTKHFLWILSLEIPLILFLLPREKNEGNNYAETEQ